MQAKIITRALLAGTTAMLLTTASAVAGPDCSPSGNCGYEDGTSVDFGVLPGNSIHQSLLEMEVGEPGTPEHQRVELRVDHDVAPTAVGKLTASWNLSRNGQRPTVETEGPFPIDCGGRPGAKVTLVTYASTGTLTAEVAWGGSSIGEPVTVRIPKQTVAGEAKRVPVKVCAI